MIPLFTTLDDDQRKTVDVLHSVEGWPIDFGKDADLVTRMAEVYPGVELYAEAVAFAAWMSEHKQKKQIKYRARFTNWVKKSDEWARRNPGNRRAHRAPEQDTHGDSVSAREGF